VNRRFKLVAMLLSLVLFGSPLVAVANCNPKVAMAVHCCGHCPMMMPGHMGRTATYQVSATPMADGSCCQVSNPPESTAKPTTVPEVKTFVSSSTPQTVAAFMPVVSSPAEGPPATILFPSMSQAVLCTFLV